MWDVEKIKIKDFKDKIFTDIVRSESNSTLTFYSGTDVIYEMYHEQDCCEGVWLEDICGDLDDLLGLPILEAFEKTNHDNPLSDGDECHTWTFYTLVTMKGTVTLRWYGTSNGYYSEQVDIRKVLPKN